FADARKTVSRSAERVKSRNRPKRQDHRDDRRMAKGAAHVAREVAAGERCGLCAHPMQRARLAVAHELQFPSNTIDAIPGATTTCEEGSKALGVLFVYTCNLTGKETRFRVQVDGIVFGNVEATERIAAIEFHEVTDPFLCPGEEFRQHVG